MPHSAAMPYCIRKPLCLPGPQPLCPSVFASHLLTVGIRHAPIIQAMYPPVALCRLGHPRHLQVLSELGSRLSSLTTTLLPCASKLKELAGDMNVGFAQIILLALSHRLPLTETQPQLLASLSSQRPRQMMCGGHKVDMLLSST